MPAGFGTSRQDNLVTILPTATSVMDQETGDAEEDEGQFFEKVWPPAVKDRGDRGTQLPEDRSPK